MTIAWLGMGSNIEDRLGYLQAGIAGTRGLPDTHILAKSAVYETAPVGGVEQGPFLNGVVKIETSLTPEQLLEGVLQVEKANGRERVVHWGPRTLDIDILAYGQEVIAKSYLKVPHPYLAERAFVLLPWAEIGGDWQVPGLGKVDELLEKLPVLELVGVEKTGYMW